jgi:hypothetical protein
MSTTVAFPTSPEQLDPSSLSNLLGPRWLAGTSIDAVRAHPMGDGQGLLGQVCVLDVHYQGPTELPSSFVVKLPATNAASRSTARLGGLYLREFHFFTELAPGHGLSVPRCWAARFDEATHDFVLVLDRVDPLEPVDQLEGCPIERARATVSELARLHACWWDSPILPTLAWLPSFATAARIENLTNMARQGWPLLASSPPTFSSLGTRP